MNVEIRTEAAQFLFGEYINGIFFAVWPYLGAPRDPRLEDLISQREGMHGSTESTRPCLPYVVQLMSDGCVHLLYNCSWKFHQLAAGQFLSGQPVRYGKGRRHAPYFTYKITPVGSLASSQPSGPQCSAASLLPSVQSVLSNAGPSFLSNVFTIIMEPAKMRQIWQAGPPNSQTEFVQIVGNEK